MLIHQISHMNIYISPSTVLPSSGTDCAVQCLIYFYQPLPKDKVFLGHVRFSIFFFSINTYQDGCQHNSMSSSIFQQGSNSNYF